MPFITRNEYKRLLDSEQPLSQSEREAIDFAAEHHAQQTDKAGRCYLAHLFRVAFSVRHRGEKFFIVGMLHDVVEDTSATVQEIWEKFGAEIADAVEAITRRERAMQKEHYPAFIERCAANPISRIVKLADIEDNLLPERVGLLSTADQERIQRKYESAKVILGASAGPAKEGA